MTKRSSNLKRVAADGAKEKSSSQIEETDDEDASEEESESEESESESPPRKRTQKEKKEKSIFADQDDGFFTEHANDQKFLALKQASKLDYYRKENEQLREQVRNLTMNLKLNKQLLALTEDTSNSANKQKEPNCGEDSSRSAQIEAKLKGYQEREEAMQKQLDQAIK